MRTRNDLVLNDRPHPGPLPQERENRSPAFGGASALCNSSDSACESPGRGNRQIGFQTTRDGRWLSPLPEGEGQGEGGRNN